ncbi:hypothetical protein QM480_21185 [Flectobacillus sp. DC10W]|uniref:Uncharacterized protein n=1 Tax=Flectobacillus longus TaxID=2984207 RepID=A0ABT6YTH5_9BACT|nr:hypothetical protein [Flectobacillus longus]MDI9866866.1 hypothetical protein [Flectobacillus longus]
MNTVIHLLIILLNIYTIVFLFLLIQKIFPTKKTTLHLLFTLTTVFICFTISSVNTPTLNISNLSAKSVNRNYSIDPLCEVELSFTTNLQACDTSVYVASKLKGLMAGLQWQQDSVVRTTKLSYIHYKVIGRIKYLILGFPVLSSNQVFSGMIKFDELRRHQESSIKWNTSINNNLPNSLIQKMY